MSSADHHDLEAILAECLERFDTAGEDAALAVIDAHPEHSKTLRRTLQRLREAGLTRARQAQLESIPDRLGDFKLLRRLGGGGMGVVYLARDESLGRLVAIKLIRPEQMFFESARARFDREIEMIARMRHPGIVPIYSVGEESGVRFFAMEWVDGCTLAELMMEFAPLSMTTLDGGDLFAAIERACKRRESVGRDDEASAREPSSQASDHASRDPQSQDEPSGDQQPGNRASSDGQTGDRQRLFEGPWASCCARIVQTVAAAAEHAHERGVLHRDIKPSNLMLTRDGRVLILDFGLAQVDDDTRLTRSGTPVGSLVYMAPEQLRAETIDARADVYSLGVTLYELLCGTPPFRANKPDELRMEILRGEAIRLRQHNRSVPQDLETICHAAIDPSPAKRYANMAEFARDLGRFLAKEPIFARPPNLWRRLSRLVQRRPAATLALLLAFVAFVVVPVIALRAAWTTARERAIAEHQSYVANVAAAASAIRLFDVGEARVRLENAAPKFRNWEWYFLAGQLDESRAQLALPDVAPGPGKEPAVAMTPDGRWIFAAGYRTIRVFDARTLAQHRHVDCSEGSVRRLVLAFDMAPNGRMAAVSVRPKEVHIFGLPDCERLLVIPLEANANALAFSPDSSLIATTSAAATSRVWDVKDGSLRHEIPTPGGASSIAFTRSGSAIITGGIIPSTAIRVWDLAEKELIASLDGHSSTVSALAVHPDGRRLVSGSMDYSLAIWDLTTQQLVAQRDAHENGIIDLSISADGRFIASGSMDRTIRRFDAKTLEPVSTLIGHTGHVRSVRHAPGNRLISASRDGTVRIWEPRRRESVRILHGPHGASYASVAFGPGEQQLTCVSESEIAIWDLETERKESSLPIKIGMHRSVLHHRGHVVIGGVSTVYDGKNLRELHRLVNRKQGTFLGLAPYRDEVLVGHSGGEVWRWDPETWEKIAAVDSMRAKMYFSSLAISDDERRLAAWDRIGSLKIYELPTFRLLSTHPTGETPTMRIAIQPGTHRAALASRTLEIFDLDSGQRVRCEGHTGIISGIAFSPDGSRLASAATDGSMRIWDPETGQQLLVRRLASPYCTAVSWSPDGKQLAAGGGNYDTRVVIWTAADEPR